MTAMGATTRNQELARGVLSRLALFSGSSPPQLDALARQCWTLAARAGDVVARRGERLAGVYAIGYGTVKLVLRGPGDEEHVLRLVSAGQTFGEAAALLSHPARYEALALCETKLVVVPSTAIVALIERDPRFAHGVIRLMGERTLELIDEVEAATMRSGAQRLASYLRALGQPSDASAPFTVRLPASKTVVAARLGIKKETLSRLFRRFEARGLIAVSRSDIEILDRVSLTELAG